RLNAAAFTSPQGLNIALRREVRNRSASPLHQWDRRGCTASSPSAPGLTTVVVMPSVRVASCAALPVPPLAPFLRSSALRSSRALPAFSATTASADFSPALPEELSPGKVQNLFPRAACLCL